MRPLEGVKVVELGVYVAGPGLSRLLGDWGAEVIKVEPPKGDSCRYSGAQARMPIKPDCNLTFSIANSGKKLIGIDLKTPEGMEVMEKLLSDADIFVSNIRYGGLSRLGLDYESLHKRLPGLICCYINGYGFEGEEKDKVGFDLTGFWSKSGILNAMRDPGMVPRFPPPGIGDLSTANVAAAGVLAALFHRTRTGEGLQVTTSLMATGVWSNYSHVTSGQDRPPQDHLKPLHTPEPFKDWKNPFYHIYKCKDERLFFLLGGSYSKLPLTLKALGLDDLVDDPRYQTHTSMRENSSELYDRMIEAFAQKTAQEWVEILEPLDIAFDVLAQNWEIYKDPQVWANGCLGYMDCPDGSTYVVPTTPVDFSGVERAKSQHVGTVGCHTSQIMQEYGYTAQQIQELMDKGVVVGK